ncbi:MAG: hypothetical protein ACK46L_06675 [Synechococcaceae cyanobacterium]
MPTINLGSSTSTTIPNIWSGSSSRSLSYGRFLGFANAGWGIYNSTAGLPAPRSVSGDYKSPTVLGFGAGAGYNGSLRTGINLDLQATAGSANLNLNDSISFTWSQDSTNFYLNSSYNYSPSSLLVNGPSATLKVDGRFDVNASVYLQARTPFTGWSNIWSRSLSNNTPLFSRSFSSTGSASVSLLGGTASLSYQGVNLSTTSANNSQLIRGVRSRIKDPVIGASLDLDRALGTFVGLPSGLTFGGSASLGPLKGSASLTLADAGINYTGSIDQTLDAVVDRVTGTLTIEGKSLNYTVGTQVTLPKATYDANRDNKLDISGIFTKEGTVTNRTDVVNDLSARVKALSGSVRATARVPDPVWYNPFRTREATIFSASVGPLYDSGNFNLTSNSINAYSNSWATNFGTKSLSFALA